MDWLLASPQINSAFSSLGSIEGDSYVVNPNALAILEEINYKLTYEDQTLRTFRRAIGFSQNVRIDLIPLLENVKDYAILDAVIRILVNLTIPVECLFSVDVMYRTEVGRLTIFELNKLLYTSKEAFTDPKSTKSVIEYMKHILESDSKLSPQKCDQINNCLLLLRNILHIPENNENFVVPTSQAAGTYTVSMQNAILWNLFIQSIDKLLLYLMTCPQRAFWGVTIVQLIALIYKDQHVNTLQKLLNLWFEASLSESSEDNESNTSPPKQGSGDSSPMLTSDPTSDSSDNGSGVSKADSTSEERRQVLREEATEATLQEVSRIGQVYQDAIHRIPSDSFDDTNDINTKTHHQDYQESMEFSKEPTFIDAAPHHSPSSSSALEDAKQSIGTIAPPENNEMKEYVMKMNENEKEKEIKHEIEKLQIQPAERSENTTKLKSPKKMAKISNDGAFKPPLALPLKALCPPPTKEQLIKVKKIEAVIRDEDSTPPPTTQKSPHSGQLSLTKGKCCPQKRECPSSQSELSDCGYGTQVENQESISTSSNEDDSPLNKPQHQKPPCNSKPRNKQRSVLTPVDTKELRRKKLVKRSKSSLINMKGLVQHTPTDEDISNLLKEFTVDFLLKGYGHLVEELHSQLLTNMKIPIDTSHFFWLVTYFLKFAAQLELDMEHINTILTFDVISYLTYEGVTLCEQLELNAGQEGTDMKPYLRRMHLVVTAIREFLQAIETYKKVSHLSEDDRERLRRLQIQISTTEDLRCLFVLLLRNFNPSLHTKQYLQDLVVTNHILLLILDGVTKTEEKLSVNMTEHVAQFATLEIMYYYGILLEDFNNNGEFVNDCIFTMMHHIGGDLGHIGTLFQPVILKTYSRIWEADYELCDDWSDLIEYVIHKFMKTPQKSPLAMPSASLTELTKEYNSENTVCTWTQEEMDTLYWYYVQSKKATDVIGKIVKLFSNNGNKEKSRISIIQQLLQQDIINLVEYDDLMKFEDAEYQRALLTTPTSVTTESGIEAVSCNKSADDIQILRDLIIKEKKEYTLVWLQKILLECCYIKLTLRTVKSAAEREKLKYIMEPVAYHCILKNKSIPVVQWNAEHAATMLYQPFILLLHKLGFQLPADAGSVFVRIPDYWTPETMYNLAKKMGSMDELLLKFDRSQLSEDADTSSTSPRCQHPHIPVRASISSLSSFEAELTEESDDLSLIPELEDPIMEKQSDIFALPRVKHCHSIIRYTPDPLSPPTVPNWLQLVMRSKGNSMASALNTLEKNEIEIQQPDLFPGNPTQSLVPPNTLSSSTAAEGMIGVPITSNVTSHQFLVPTSLSIPIVPNIATQLLCPSITNVIGVNNSKSSDKSDNNIDQSKHLVNIARASTITTSSTTATKMTPTPAAPSTSTSAAGATAATAAAATAASANRIKIEFQNENVNMHVNPVNDRGEPLAKEAVVVVTANLPDPDTSMKSYNRNLENEYSAMVASVYENEIANSDNASVASDLTRMYVSDEDERHEYSVTHFH